MAIGDASDALLQSVCRRHSALYRGPIPAYPLRPSLNHPHLRPPTHPPTHSHPQPPNAGFAAKARGVAELQFDAAALQQRWDMRVLPPAGGVTTFVDAESAERFADYCAAAVVPPGTLFDLVSVAGFARVACLQRAVQLVRPQGGLLVLPQAQRATYAGAERLVPPHWLRLTDAHSFGTTYVWMSMEAP